LAFDPTAAETERTFTLIDHAGQIGTSAWLDGKVFKTPVSERPTAGTTEIWRIVDATQESHLIHLDLVNFQVISRQGIDVGNYRADWLAANGGSLPFVDQTSNVELSRYLLGDATGPAPIEKGPKDSIRIDPGEVVTLLVRFAPSDGRVAYPFDPTDGPSYIWNSNIFDHEMNEMMRRFSVVP
jgi:spore coat protein A